MCRQKWPKRLWRLEARTRKALPGKNGEICGRLLRNAGSIKPEFLKHFLGSVGQKYPRTVPTWFWTIWQNYCVKRGKYEAVREPWGLNEEMLRAKRKNTDQKRRSFAETRTSARQHGPRQPQTTAPTPSSASITCLVGSLPHSIHRSSCRGTNTKKPAFTCIHCMWVALLYFCLFHITESRVACAVSPHKILCR